jgi:hypothetical protein
MERDRNREYFLERARCERRKAGTCEDRAVAIAHLKMADEYDRRISQPAGLVA